MLTVVPAPNGPPLGHRFQKVFPPYPGLCRVAILDTTWWILLELELSQMDGPRDSAVRFQIPTNTWCSHRRLRKIIHPGVH